jgi:hypothetical protein
MLDGGIAILCPACKYCHVLNVERDGGSRWSWNDDLERPTFSPSLLVRRRRGGPEICHSFIRGGRIEYCADSTHALAGLTVDLPCFSWGGEE